MKGIKQILLFLLGVYPLFLQAQSAFPKPTKAQLAWHKMEYYLFMHFGPNTFTDREWGHGNEKEELFNPSELDCEQWCRLAQQSGAKGIIITAKHHDGFCLWPSKFSTHTVRESKWENGHGDVLKLLSTACKKFGLSFGVYLSPWDRNHPDYGTEKYNDVFVNMMKEIFTQYGPIWELWWDGANGEGPNGKRQVYDWKRFEKTVRELSPNTVVFSDIGPDIRWVGNEEGIAGETNWNTLDTAGFSRGADGPKQEVLNRGNKQGKNWIPAECDVSIRPGWFYHQQEDLKVKTPEQIFALYVKSVGRGANLLLNVPPDRRGLITAHDSSALVGFKNLLTANFSNNLFLHATTYQLVRGNKRKAPALSDGQSNTGVEISEALHQPVGIALKDKQNKQINCVVLQEALTNGQHCSKFKLRLFNSKAQLVKEITGTTIGKKRILTFPDISVNAIELTIEEQTGMTSITDIEGYLIAKNLIEK